MAVAGIFQFLADGFEISRFKQLARTLCQRLLAFQDDLLEFFREALVREAQTAFEEFYDRLGEIEGIALFINIFFRQVVLYHVQRHITDDFGRRRNLDDIAKHEVDIVIHLLDVVPAVAETDGFRLLTEVGELSARHFTIIGFRIGIRFGFIDAFVVRTYRCPVAGHFFHGIDVKVRLTVLAAHGIVEGIHARLARAAGKGRISSIDDIDTGIGSPAESRHGIARTIVGMEMDRQIDGIFEGRNELICRFRLKKPCHILDSDDIGTGILQFFCHADIVIEIIFRTGRIEDIAGIAEGDFGNLARFPDGLHRFIHIVQTVQAVENTEYINAVLGRELYEILDHIVRVARIAYGVGAADEHLQQDIRCFLAHLAQTVPGIFIEETIGYVKGSAAPAFIGEESRQLFGSRFQHAEHIDGAYPRCHEGLVGITHSRIGDEDFLLVEDPLGEFFRSHGIKELFRPIRIRAIDGLRQFEPFKIRFFLRSRIGITVNRRIADIFQELRTTVMDDRQIEQFRMFINEIDVVIALDERRLL